VSGFRAPCSGEFETEITLAVRVAYRMDAQGEIDFTALTPTYPLHAHRLSREEQRHLRQSAECHAAAEQAAIREARDYS
jgi:hypothetical protein